MNKLNWIMITLFFGAALSALTGCQSAPPATANSPAIKYTCPMHHEIVRDAPGNCPLCGMTLVEKKH